MKCKILHESNGRMRVRFCVKRMTLKQADTAEYALSAIAGVKRVQVFDRTCDVVITYTCDRAEIIDKLSHFSFSDERNTALVPEHHDLSPNIPDANLTVITRTSLQE